MVKYVTSYPFLHAMISCTLSVDCPMTLLSRYLVCGAFYEFFYNKTLNISHNSHCINGVLVYSCFLYECYLWHCASELIKSEYGRKVHFTEDTYTKEKTKAYCTDDTTVYTVELFHIHIGRCFQLLWLKCDYFVFVYYVESKWLTFYTYRLGPSRAFLVVCVLPLYCLTNKTVSRVCLPCILSFLYVFGILLERFGKSGRQPWHDWAELKELIKEYSVYSVDIDT